jgi:hypothetical protein
MQVPLEEIEQLHQNYVAGLQQLDATIAEAERALVKLKVDRASTFGAVTAFARLLESKKPRAAPAEGAK